MPTFNSKQFNRILVKNGCTYKRMKGGHAIWEKDGKSIIVPKNTKPILMYKIIKENKLIID